MSQKCPECKSEKLVKLGKIPTRNGKKQRLRCQDCGKTMYEGAP
ncbi:IS1 family transposase [Candidatus Pacearchaeota archaeon]|nr:IS1 family transposase [Candidatus Pacearchaeota archaeon]